MSDPNYKNMIKSKKRRFDAPLLFPSNKKTLAHYHLNHYTQINFFPRFRKDKNFLQGFCRIASSVKLITSIFNKQKKFLLTTAAMPWLWFFVKKTYVIFNQKIQKVSTHNGTESPPLTRGKGYSVPWPLSKRLSCHLLYSCKTYNQWNFLSRF